MGHLRGHRLGDRELPCQHSTGVIRGGLGINRLRQPRHGGQGARLLLRHAIRLPLPNGVVAWLAARVAAGDPELTKPAFLREAQRRFGISREAFRRIWAEATRGHPAWTAPGRRRRK